MIVVCGEALVDLVPIGGGGAEPVLRALPGGGPANTAVALARLGQPVSVVTRVGSDALGELVRRHLAASGVGLDQVVTCEEPTAVAFVSLAEGGDASYSLYLQGTAAWSWRPEDLPAALGPEVEAIHTGSLVLVAPGGCAAVAALLQREHGERAISLDPNVRLAAAADPDRYRADLEGLVGLADVIRASRQDLVALFPGRDPEEVAREWASSGPRLVVLTRGRQGALAYLDGAVLERAADPVEIVDTVGAGDTFSAALLDALSRAGVLRPRLLGIDAELVARALEFASAAAAATCARAGADPPTAAEVQARLGRPASSGAGGRR